MPHKEREDPPLHKVLVRDKVDDPIDVAHNRGWEAGGRRR